MTGGSDEKLWTRCIFNRSSHAFTINNRSNFFIKKVHCFSLNGRKTTTKSCDDPPRKFCVTILSMLTCHFHARDALNLHRNWINVTDDTVLCCHIRGLCPFFPFCSGLSDHFRIVSLIVFGKCNSTYAQRCQSVFLRNYKSTYAFTFVWD